MIPRSTAIFLLFFLTFSSTFGFLKDYYCGSGLLSKVASFLSTAICDRDTLNLCCEAHDTCYGSGNGTRAECDEIFCECSAEAEKNSRICQWWIGVSHCRVVKALGERPYARSHRLLIPDEPI